MQPIQSISIPHPCHENWNQMTPVEQGRHCNLCAKTVTDFTVMSNNEIINYFTKHTNTCGRFDSHQLASVNNYLELQDKLKFSWKKLALAAAITGLFTTVKAQTPITIRKIAVLQPVKSVKRELMGDTITYKTVKGKVIGDDDNGALPGVTVRIKGTNMGTMTNATGEFILRVPSIADSLQISYVGYQTYETSIAAFADQSNCITLKMRMQMLGGAITVMRKVPFYKMWWYKLKRAF